MADYYSVFPLLKWTLMTRLFFYTLQLLVSFIPDHSHSYNTALIHEMRTDIRNSTTHSFIIELLFGGYDNWDSEYYIFIGQYGYRYELNHAFFPLYPLLMRFIAALLSYILPLPLHSLLLISGVLISNGSFIISTGVLYMLTVKVFENYIHSSSNVPISSISTVPLSTIPLSTVSSYNVPISFTSSVPSSTVPEFSTYNATLKRRPLSPSQTTVTYPVSSNVLPHSTNTLVVYNELAYLTVLLYSINPATVFMTTVYTESAFALFSFSGMLAMAHSRPFIAAVLFAGASGTRSNGIVTCGFIIYYHLLHIITLLYKTHIGVMVTAIRLILHTISMLLQVTIILLPLALFQIYSYSTLCDTTITVVLPTLCTNSSIFFLPYSYVQKKYWGLGFLKFYELKQIPNFLTACPIFIITGHGLWNYSKRISCHVKQYSTARKPLDTHIRKALCTDVTVLPYCVQLLFLLIVAAFFMHIQVTTRFICSSSPAIYWFVALIFVENHQKYTKNSNASPWKYLKQLVSSLNWNRSFYQYSLQQWVVVYFITYNIVGFVMHCNFFPWV